MNSIVLTHRSALLLLGIVAAMSLAGISHLPPGIWPPAAVQFVLAIAFWGWLIHRLWHRPRRWSLVVGGLFLFMLVFQTYLWRLALAGPLPEQLGASRSPWIFALYELPLVAGVICCFCLRRSCSAAPLA